MSGATLAAELMRLDHHLPVAGLVLLPPSLSERVRMARNEPEAGSLARRLNRDLQSDA